MYRKEPSFALVVIDYSKCDSDFLRDRQIPETPYGDRVWKNIQEIEEEFRRHGSEAIDDSPLFELKRAFIHPYADGTCKIVMPDVKEDGKLILDNNVRGRECFIISPPYITDDRYTIINAKVADALFRGDSQDGVILWEIYNGNHRQDRREGSESLNSYVIARIYEANHIAHVLGYDPHYKQIENAFTRFERLPLFGWLAVYYLNKYGVKDLTVVAPDVGAVDRARKVADFFGCPMAYMHKERDPETGEPRIVELVGNVSGKKWLIVDDLIGSGKTVVKSVDYIRKKGGREGTVMASHLQLTGNAKEKLMNLDGVRILGSDTFDHIYTPDELEVFDIADTSRMTAMVTVLKALRKHIGRFFQWEREENWDVMQLTSLYSTD